MSSGKDVRRSFYYDSPTRSGTRIEEKSSLVVLAVASHNQWPVAKVVQVHKYSESAIQRV